MKRTIRTFLGILIAVALLGAYAIASRNGPTGSGQDPPAAGFSH
jgi:predicted outer membrane protein